MQANQMTTDSTSVINTEQTLAALGKLFQQAGETAEHNRLVESLKQSRMNVEAEAYSTGQIHARRILAGGDYFTLCRMLDESREMIDEEEDLFSSYDGDPTIADHDFQMDLMTYPRELQPAVFAGFYGEAKRIYSEVSA